MGGNFSNDGGLTWMPVTAMWACNGKYSVGAAQFVSVGGGSYCNSSDGLTWTQSIAASGSPQLNDVAYGPSTSGTGWLAVGSQTGGGAQSVYFSTNGTGWSAVNFTSHAFTTVDTDGGGFWVTYGTPISPPGPPTIFTGLGAGWTSIAATAGWSVSRIRYMNGRFFACCSAGLSSSIEYSTNAGATWTPSVNGSSMFTLCNSVAFGASRLVAVGQSGPFTIAYSNDSGANWTGVAGSTTLLAAGQDVVFDIYSGRFVAFGTPGTSGDRVATSTDGITWTNSAGTSAIAAVSGLWALNRL